MMRRWLKRSTASTPTRPESASPLDEGARSPFSGADGDGESQPNEPHRFLTRCRRCHVLGSWLVSSGAAAAPEAVNTTPAAAPCGEEGGGAAVDEKN
jgi:hypothetical protein